MSRDDAEDLRATVEELEATVRGLTQELVEATERIRQLEAEVEDDAPANRPMPDEREGRSTGDGSAAESTDDEAGNGETTGTDEEAEDDIIVA